MALSRLLRDLSISFSSSCFLLKYANMTNKIQSSSLQAAGVILDDADTVYVDSTAEIAAGASIGPLVIIRGKSSIAAGVRIDGCAQITDSTIGANAHLKFGCVITDSTVGAGCAIGPFAHLRPQSQLESDVHIGNFVEVKKSLLRKGAKANHLAYLGDSEIGERANIGAGTITCNYDGVRKSRTEVGAEAFIGSNSSLVAPVKIGAGATIGAGSVITKDVPPEALALTRAELTVKTGYRKNKKS